MKYKNFDYMIIKHKFGSKQVYQIFIKEGKMGLYNSLTHKLFTTKLQAHKYAMAYVRKHQ